MASEHAKKLREVAAQISTERFQGWANPLVGVITDAADFLDGTVIADTGDAVLSRPAATDTGLETVERQYRWGGDPKWKPFGLIFDDEPRETRALVTRSQAEELLAAERAEKEQLLEECRNTIASLIPRAPKCGRYLAECNDGRLLYLNHGNTWQECPNFIKTKDKLIQSLIDLDSDEVKRLEADNAAQAARIKELEADVKREAQSSTHNAQDCLDEQLRAEALEAKLAAGKITFHLEWVAAARKPVHPEPMTGRQSFSSFDEAIAFMKRQAPDAQFVSLTERMIIQTDEDRSTEARAVLGGEPS